MLCNVWRNSTHISFRVAFGAMNRILWFWNSRTVFIYRSDLFHCDLLLIFSHCCLRLTGSGWCCVAVRWQAGRWYGLDRTTVQWRAMFQVQLIYPFLELFFLHRVFFMVLVHVWRNLCNRRLHVWFVLIRSETIHWCGLFAFGAVSEWTFLND